MYTVWMSTNAYMNGNSSKQAEDKEDETIPKKVMPGCVGIKFRQKTKRVPVEVHLLSLRRRHVRL